MKKQHGVHLGFEVPTGLPIELPLRHLAVTGQTQEAGKTTTLEALIERSGLRAVTFVTKRGEGSFRGARRIEPYFREQTDWQFVASVLEASRGEKLKFERAWIIRASKGARTLADVQRNVRELMESARGMSADVYLTLDAYLEVVVPAIAAVKWAPSLDLAPGVNAVDLSALSGEMQHLVIRSALQWVLEREHGTVVVIPEAWKFIPQGRGTPVKLAAEAFIRQGAALQNYLWLDSQDLGGIEKAILRSVPVWLLGVQREANEIKRTLDNIPAGTAKPRPADIARLGLGEFYACWGEHVVKTYVQPAWMDAMGAELAARGRIAPERLAAADRRSQAPPKTVATPSPKQEDPSMCEKHAELQREVDQLRDKLRLAESKAVETYQDMRRAQERADAAAERQLAFDRLGTALAAVLPPTITGVDMPYAGVVDEDAIVARVLARLPAGGAGPITITPPEKLRKDFQREESDRIVAAVRALDPLQKRVLKLLQTTEAGAFVGQPTLNLRLGRTTSGGSMTTMGSAVRGLAALGFVDVKDRAGVKNQLREKIAADLAFYQASATDVEAVYQSVLFEIAAEQ